MLPRRLVVEWILVLLAASLLVVLAVLNGWTRPVDDRIYDIAVGADAPLPDDRIIVIEIDDASLRHFGRWPWSRDVHGKLLQALARARPRAIGYDLLLLEPSAEDLVLADALRAAGKVYFPSLIRHATAIGEADELISPTPAVANAAAGIGVAEVIVDEDGVVRRADTQTVVAGKAIPQMVLMLARQADPALSLPTVQPFLLPYTRFGSFRRVSFVNVANGEVPAELLRDKLVLIGATADGMGDVYPVPSRAGGLMPGVTIQANLLNTLLTGKVIGTPSRLWVALLSLLPSWLVLVAFLRFRPSANLRLAAAAVVGMAALSFLLVPLARLWLPPGAALLGVLLVYILWGWRRLAATSQFIGEQTVAIEGDPGIARHLARRDALTDSLAYDAGHLQDIIGQLRALRQFTADVIERLPDATVVVDAADSITLANEAADLLFGGDVLGQKLGHFLARLTRDATRDGNRISRPGGQTLVVTDAPLSGGSRIIRFADMTDLQRATDEREEVLQFLSHDLRSPNAAILTLLEMHSTGKDAPSADFPAEAVDQIRTHARHGLRLADDFVQLARARRRPILPEAVDLCDVAREAGDMIWPRAVEREIRIEDASEEGELWVMGDRAMLVRATVNLLDNAVKFAPEGAQVRMAVKQLGEQARLEVSGPGPEMPPGRAERPFALYAEGRDVRGRVSIGLGLAFVQATAIRHGGIADYSYRQGYGATFTITLPLAAED